MNLKSIRMKIVVAGTRGIPDIQGGVETHCQNLYPRIAAMGHDITLIRRTPYVAPDNRLDSYGGVKLMDVYAPRRKSLEAIVHTALAVVKAKKLKADVVHIHAIGPALMVPLAKLLGLRVVVTHHGADYERQKWGRMAKFMLRTGERMAARFADSIISISQYISDSLARKYGRADAALIYNGVNPPVAATTTDYIRSLGLEKGRYVVALGRFVPEKGFHDLIEAFRDMPGGYKLVIAGDADHPSDYSTELKAQARRAGTVLPGFIHGAELNELMSHAALFCMPSYHEGLPIALLEAMSYGLDVVVSDIPACRIPELAPADYFPAGDKAAIADAIRRKLGEGPGRRAYDLTSYNWDSIARQTEVVYISLLAGSRQM